MHDENRIKQNLPLYDYSKTIYNGLEYYSTFICPEHGEFEQTCGNHISQKQGCPKCISRYRETKWESELKIFLC